MQASAAHDRTRILIASSDSFTIYSLRRLFATQNDLEVVAEVGENAKLANYVFDLMPDITFIDSPTLKLDVLDTIARIRTLAPTTYIILLTMQDNIDSFVRACKAGVRGYLLKSRGIEQVVPAIKAVIANKMIIEPSLVESMIERFSYRLPRNRQAFARDELTKRELELLTLAARGYSNKQIALQLETSQFTVKAQISNLLSKLGVHNRTEAVSLATTKKLISRDGLLG